MVVGGGFLKNKISLIEDNISQYKPHILGISETYFRKGQNIEEIKIDDYDVFMSKTLDNPDLNVSRIVVFAQKSIPKLILRTDPWMISSVQFGWRLAFSIKKVFLSGVFIETGNILGKMSIHP